MKTIAKLDLKTYNEEKKQFEMCVDARTLMTFERIYRLETKNGKATFINSLPSGSIFKSSRHLATPSMTV